MGKPATSRKHTKTPTPAAATTPEVAAAAAATDEPAAKIARRAASSAGRRIPFALPIPQRARRTGTLLSCGQNEVGQLGLGEDVPEKTRPACIPGVPAGSVVDIAAGGMHSLFLTATGDVFSFGCNDEGALGRDSSAEGADEFAIVRVADLPAGVPVVRVSAGDSHSACLLEDGRVLAWGSFRDSHGNMGLTLEGNKRRPIEVVPGLRCADIQSGADHLVMLTVDGKVYTVGCAEQGQLGRVTMRSSGGESRRGKTELLRPGQVQFKRGVLMDAIWATTYCTFARVHGTSEIVAFGLNNYAQLATAEAEQLYFNPKTTTIRDVKAISGGQHHTLLLTTDDRCLVIGRRDYGRLGIGANVAADVTQLTEIPALTGKGVVQVACGESCSFARTADGQVYAWGIGSNQQLGVGSEEDAYEPVLLTGVQVKGKEVLNVNGGGQHTLLLVASEPAAVEKAANGTAAAVAKTNGTAATKKAAAAEAKKQAEEPKLVEKAASLATTEPATESSSDDVEAEEPLETGEAAADAAAAVDEPMPDSTEATADAAAQEAAAGKAATKKVAAPRKKAVAKPTKKSAAAAVTEDTAGESTAAAAVEPAEEPAAENDADFGANESIKSSKSSKSSTKGAAKQKAATTTKAPAKKRKL